MVEITRTFDLLDLLVEQYPKEDILAGKVNGEWVKYSSHDYYKYAHYLAYGLCEMGLKQGDRVVTMSANCPEWNFIDMALAMSGIIHVPIYPTLNTESYLHILNHSEATAVFVSTKVLLGRLRQALDQAEVKPQVFTLANIEGEHRMLEILKAGIANRDKWMAEIERRKREIKPDDWMTMIYTSGTTGLPKGVMLSHRNLCSNFLAHAPVNPCDDKCKFLSFLPLNHIYERSMNYHYQSKGISIYYAESLGTIQQNMQEIAADGFCAVPRVLEMVYDKLYAAGKDFRGTKKKIYDWAFSHGKRYDYTLLKKVSLFYQLAQWFLDKAVYSKWREKFGGKRLTVITGGSSIQPDMVRLFAAAGINIYEGYGLSETSPVIAVNDPAHHQVKIGTVGPILRGVEVKFDEPTVIREGTQFNDVNYALMGQRRLEIVPNKNGKVLPEDFIHQGNFEPGIAEALRYMEDVNEQLTRVREVITLITQGDSTHKSAQEIYEYVMQTTEGILDNADKTLDKLTPAVKQLVDQLNQAANSVAEMANQVDTTVKTTTGAINEKIAQADSVVQAIAEGTKKAEQIIASIESTPAVDKLLNTKDLVDHANDLVKKTQALIAAIDTKGVKMYDENGKEVSLFTWKNTNLIGKTAREKAKLRAEKGESLPDSAPADGK